MPKLCLRDYKNNPIPSPLELDDLDKVEEITITVLSGDEVIDVLYTNGASIHFDSDINYHRDVSYFDGTYIIYSKRRNIDRMEKFLETTDTYEMFEVIANEEN